MSTRQEKKWASHHVFQEYQKMSKGISSYLENQTMNVLTIAGVSFLAVVVYMTKDTIETKINEAKAMYDYLFRINHENHLRTIYHIAQSACVFCRIYLTQHVFHNFKKIGKNRYEIEYTIHCKTYRFQTAYSQGPSKYMKFMQNESVDVSDKIFPYVGPSDDFHRIPYTPANLGCSNLTVHYRNGEVKQVPDHIPIIHAP